MSRTYLRSWLGHARGLLLILGTIIAIFVGGEVVMLLRAGELEAREETPASPTMAAAAVPAAPALGGGGALPVAAIRLGARGPSGSASLAQARDQNGQ